MVVAQSGRQICHLARVGDKPAVVVVGQLSGTETRQTQLSDGGGSPGFVEIGEVPWRHGAPRGLEYQFLLHIAVQYPPGRRETSHSARADTRSQQDHRPANSHGQVIGSGQQRQHDPRRGRRWQDRIDAVHDPAVPG